MRVLIIDDEKKAREGIKILLKDYDEVFVVGEASNGKEAIERIIKEAPDLIFLDIQMPGINGFDVLGSIPQRQIPIVIFATAYDQYAMKAFEVQALDYLLKPFSSERFQQALNQAFMQWHNKNESAFDNQVKKLLEAYQLIQKEDEILHTGEQEIDQLMIKSQGRVYFLNFQEVFWVEALDSYVKIYLQDKMHIVKSSLKSLEQKMSSVLVRIHRSHLVNFQQVVEMEPYFNGDFYLKLKNGQSVKGSRKFKNNLPKLL